MLSFSCNRHNRMSAREREIERTRIEREEEDQKQYEEAVKRHMEMQSKETRRRMRQNARTSESVRTGEEESWFFLKRWFKPKRKKADPAGRSTR